MTVTRIELKNKAKEQIRGNIGILFLINLIFVLIYVVVSLIPFVNIISGLLYSVFAVGLATIYIALTRGERPEVADLFKGFHIFGKAAWLGIITGFFVMLWTLLLVIPGIIKAISYAFAPYILAENPELTAREALRESKRITYGHKMDFFILGWSFFWWELLAVITLGLAGIYVAPYIQATIANFYNEIKGDNGIPLPTIEVLESGIQENNETI
ncbi:MAG: DUF975 family protein [Peptococcaceae bacterium]|jgi:uncharacterized membrane protein|nr:DUF975 family protein [Peptococcaceae bacterium]